MNFDLYPAPYTKLTQNTPDLNVKTKIVILLGKKLGEDFCDTVLGKDFLIMN